MTDLVPYPMTELPDFTVTVATTYLCTYGVPKVQHCRKIIETADSIGTITLHV
jgi:hypothetical protein